MFESLLKKFFGDKNVKAAKDLWPIVEQINAEYEKLKDITDDELHAKTTEFKNRIEEYTRETKTPLDELKIKLQDVQSVEDKHAIYDEVERLENELTDKYEEILDEILPEAFAVVKDTCRRLTGKSWEAAGNKITWDMIPYDVQLLGGIVLHQGKIAEMATGEGKTLVATLPTYLNALSGRGVHIVTVNDYLALRDSQWMGKVFEFHGLKIGVILQPMDPSQRRVHYAADITYGTNNEFGFDYLRDNMVVSADEMVQRGHNYAIVDEVDSVLIDEARTPLIISGPVESEDHKFDEMKPYVDRLVRAQMNLVAETLAQAERL